MEYHGSKLNSIEKEFYLKMLDALRNRLSFVKAKGIANEAQFLKCISAVQYDYPELFYVDFRHFKYVAYSDGWEYRPEYLYDNAESLEREQQLNLSVDKIVREIEKRQLNSVYQKCGYIHSYLVRNCTYDYAALEDLDGRRTAYTVEGPLLEKTGVCQGIAFVYRMICRKCGIEAIAVKGVSLRPGCTTYEGHAWNLIRVGECAAQIDVTWDMCLTSEDRPIRYDYFFLPDIDMMRDHQYVGYPICRRMNMSYFERSKTSFKQLNELDSYIKQVLYKDGDKCKKGTYYFQFKIVNRKETKEDIQNYVKDAIKKNTNKGFSYSITINSAQSVFLYKVEMK